MASSSVSGGADSHYTSGSRGQPSVGRRSEDSNRAMDSAPYGRSPLGQGGVPARPVDTRRKASQDSTGEQRRPSASSLPRNDLRGQDKSMVPAIPPVPVRQGSQDSTRHRVSEASAAGQTQAEYGHPPRTSEDRTRPEPTPIDSPARPSRPIRPPAIQQTPPTTVGIPGVSNGSQSQVHAGQEELTPKPVQNRQFLAPIITTTQPSPNSSPNPASNAKEVKAGGHNDRRDMARRATFVAPAQTVPYSREVLLHGAGGSFSQTEQLLDAEAGAEELEDATLANVEEMLEGFDFGMDSGNSQQGTAEAIEARLLNELNALEAVRFGPRAAPLSDS